MSASCALRTVGIPIMDILDTICERTVDCIFEEDNQTCISTWKAGHSPTMRHLKRCHNICLRWLHDVTYELGLCKVGSGSYFAWVEPGQADWMRNVESAPGGSRGARSP